MTRNLGVSADRISADIDALARITDPERPYTRRAFTPRFLDGRAWLARRFAEAGFATHIDAAGNLVGRRPGNGAAAGVIMLGSHSDTVPDGGRYDGIAGVVAALEVGRALAEQGVTLAHDLEIVDFLAEEVSIFGVSCIGSRGMSGTRPAEWLSRERDGASLAQRIAEVGGDPVVHEARSDVAAFLELHIEQGPVLERERLDVGLVTAIAGITRIEVIVEGRADHAGTTPMDGRRDALASAARMVIAVERLARGLTEYGYHFAATVGEFAIEPNSANVIPARARLLIDARAERRTDMEHFLKAFETQVLDIAAGDGLAPPAIRVISDNPPTDCDAGVLEVLAASADALGCRHRRMASGAGHDTAWMARITRSAMVFVPCREGRSHAPDEYADPAAIALGAAVLLDAVKRLDGMDLADGRTLSLQPAR